MAESLDLVRRKPVWMALSEFYLDSELTDEGLQRIKDVFIASGYDMDEIRYIDRNEVRPSVGLNFFGVAGVWSGFDEQWLCTEILQRSTKGNPKWWQRIWLRDSLSERYWVRIDGL